MDIKQLIEKVVYGEDPKSIINSDLNEAKYSNVARAVKDLKKNVDIVDMALKGDNIANFVATVTDLKDLLNDVHSAMKKDKDIQAAITKAKF